MKTGILLRGALCVLLAFTAFGFVDHDELAALIAADPTTNVVLYIIGGLGALLAAWWNSVAREKYKKWLLQELMIPVPHGPWSVLRPI